MVGNFIVQGPQQTLRQPPVLKNSVCIEKETLFKCLFSSSNLRSVRLSDKARVRIVLTTLFLMLLSVGYFLLLSALNILMEV